MVKWLLLDFVSALFLTGDKNVSKLGPICILVFLSFSHLCRYAEAWFHFVSLVTLMIIILPPTICYEFLLTFSICIPPAFETSITKINDTALGRYSMSLCVTSFDPPMPGVSTRIVSLCQTKIMTKASSAKSFTRTKVLVLFKLTKYQKQPYVTETWGYEDVCKDNQTNCSVVVLKKKGF